MVTARTVGRIRNQSYVLCVHRREDQLQGKPNGVRQQAALYALFPPLSMGLRPVFFFPDSGNLVLQPSIDDHDLSMPFRFRRQLNPFCQKRSKTLALRYSLKRRDEEYGIHSSTVISAFTMNTERIIGLVLRDKRCHFLPEHIAYPPSAACDIFTFTKYHL